MHVTAIVLLVLIVAVVITMCMCKKSTAYKASGRVFASPGGSPVELQSWEEFQEATSQDDRCVVLGYADWCGHCQQCKPAYEQAAKQSKTPFYQVNCEKAFTAEQMQQLGIQGFPHIVLMSKGNVLRQHSDERTVESFTQFAAS
tara:strand:- start:330 stop:761 length:432 start_codon:yes stop_codon:yes gene_type:complete